MTTLLITSDKNSTVREIKDIETRMLLLHPELMQRVNLSASILLDPEKRDNTQDDERSSNLVSGSLNCGFKLSDEFKKRIEFWKKEGPPHRGRVAFRNPNIRNQEADQSGWTDNSPKQVYEQLLKTQVPTVEATLSTVIPQWIWNWSFEKNLLTIPTQILNSEFWKGEDFPTLLTEKEIPIDYENEMRLAEKMMKLRRFCENFTPPDIQNIKASISDYFSEQTPSIFYSTIRRFPGTCVPLGPESLEEELGYIPQVTIKNNALKLNTTANHCSDCDSDFGLFRWRYNCLSCGKADCIDCLGFRRTPEYVDPVLVCRDCAGDSILYKVYWIGDVNDPSVREKITVKYLALLAKSVDASQFLKWVDLFLNDQRFDLAIACNYYGKGDWIDLANIFIRLRNYEMALICLSQIKNTKDEWSKLGDSFAMAKPRLSLLCYQKAKLDALGYEVAANAFSHYFIGKVCLIIAMDMAKTKREQQTLLNDAAQKAIQAKQYDFAAFCYTLLKRPITKWIEIVNASDIEAASVFVQHMNLLFKCDWKSICFTPDKDHLRWQFLGNPQFDRWLDYLIALLQECDGRYCIPYFRSQMIQENFMEDRDRFLAERDYTKALICHRLIPHGLSWAGLSQEWRTKDEMASFACHLSSDEDIERIGDELFKSKDYSQALRCYVSSGNFKKIFEQSQTVEYEIRLLYQLAILKYDPQPRNIILDICQTLQANPDHLPAIQKILIASLQNPPSKTDPTPFHRMLADTGLNEIELLGLIEWVAFNDKAWAASVLEKILKNFEVSLHKALNSSSHSDLMYLLERINLTTLPALEEVIKDLRLDSLERSPRKSMGLIVRAISFLADPKGPRLFEAMNDVTEALLGDPRDELIQLCAVLIDKISNRIKSAQFRGTGMTEIQLPRKSEFTKRLKRTPYLEKISTTEEAIKQCGPFEAAMSYIDLSMAIPSAAGTVGSFLAAALELLQASRQSLRPTSEERYAYHRAIVELVLTAYALGNRHLCPATQLYAIRSGIAILTSTFELSKRILPPDQAILEQLYQEVDTLSKISPMMLGQMASIYDLIYVDLLNRQFLNHYLPLKRGSVNPAEKPHFQYYMLEGTCKGWLDEEKFQFDHERKLAIDALSSDQGNTIKDVEERMHWPVLTRDSEGWLSQERMPLNLANGPQFSRVEGIRFNLETGEIAFMLVSSDRSSDSLFTMTDITEIMQRGILGAQVTLDSPDPNLPYHPFQKLTYAPNNLSGTNCLGTLLHAGLLLEMLFSGTEISAKAPFALRKADAHLLQRLPEKLQKKFTELREKHPLRKEAVHRVWIEANQLFYKEVEENNEISYTFGECEMSVKQHLDQDSKLVDTNEEDSPEDQFAKLMTKKYDRLSHYFPELARLRELAKIQAMSHFAQGIYQGVHTRIRELDVPEEVIQSDLNKIEKNKDNLKQITKILSDKYHAHEKLIFGGVANWLNFGQKNGLIQSLKFSEEIFQKQKIQRICDTFTNAGIAVHLDKSNVQDRSAWVPAAFHQSQHFRVYGGVNMQPKLTSIGHGTLPSFRERGNIPKKTQKLVI